MIERIIILDNVDPIVFFGINNSNLQLLKTLYPKLRMVARGNVIKVIGDEDELIAFEEKIHELEKFSVEMNVLKEENIIDIVKGKAPSVINVDNLIIHGLNGKPILARTANQKKLAEEFDVNDMVFAIGPAGSGKTYTAIALAVRALKTKQVRKIILSRPAVEAGEKLGFLPGDMKEKIDPYLQPLYDALEDMIPPLKLKEHERTEYQRDYDRLIFSSPFRRLQNKTQVFPLPGSVFVHNRLTHSLEVSSVGRSLGENVGRELRKRHQDSKAHFEEIGSIVSAACLAHDLGNPPFGHSGEEAISTFFLEGKGSSLQSLVEDEKGRWSDFTCFEGNANSIRLLMHKFRGRREGGFVMTYSTLASIVKYPYSSELSGGKNKFGFFASEEHDYAQIADSLGIIKLNSNPLKFARYPLVYLVEAADDICYQIMDIEDAHKLNLVSTEKAKELLLSFFDSERREKRLSNLSLVSDLNEQIAYLRASVIGLLVAECTKVFMKNEDLILSGKFEGSLIKKLPERVKNAYKTCSEFAFEKIYRSKDVLDVELAGYRIIGFLLETFTNAILTPDHTYSKLLLDRIPEQYETDSPSLYSKIQSVIDYISGMTDVYALDLYHKLTGIGLPIV
jgi:dGTPase